jgi:hypothetical protein
MYDLSKFTSRVAKKKSPKRVAHEILMQPSANRRGDCYPEACRGLNLIQYKDIEAAYLLKQLQMLRQNKKP